MSTRMSFFTSRRRGLFALAALGAAVVAWSEGCSVTTNTTAVQCTSEAECQGLGPAFAGTTCDPVSKTCVKVNEEQDLCKTNQECIDKVGGLPSICRKRDRKCVVLTSPECPSVMAQPGQLLNNDAIVIGSINPAGATELGDPMEKAVEFAQIEFSKQVRGLPAVEPGKTEPRPLVIVSCREFGTDGYDSMVRAAVHLAKNVQVPLVIGPVDAANCALTAGEVLNPARILSIFPIGQSPFLTSLPNPIAPTPINWSLGYSDANITNAAAEFVKLKLEPDVKAKNGGKPLKIAVLVEDNFQGQTSAELLEKKLLFNGKSAADNLTDGNYIRLSIGDQLDPVKNPIPEETVGKALTALYAFKPDIVFHDYAPKAIPTTFIPLLVQWPQDLPRAYHFDLIGTFKAFTPVNNIVDALAYQGRVFSFTTQVDRSAARYGAFKSRFLQQYPQFATLPAVEDPLIHFWYDATYMAAYTIVANGSKPLTGDNLATTLPQMLPPGGGKIETGPGDITKAFGLLQSGQGIDLDGLSGDMNLDPRTGFTNYDIGIVCPEIRDGHTFRFKDSGFSTLNGVGQQKGTFACEPPVP